MPRSLEEYLAQREQLIAEDTSLRQDRKKLASLTSAEEKAEQIVRAIRKEEAERVRVHSKSWSESLKSLINSYDTGLEPPE
jgi:hypothetical protein